MKIDDFDFKFDSDTTGLLTGAGALVAAIIFLGGALLVKIFGDDDKSNFSRRKEN
jgi:hypothetical protein